MNDGIMNTWTITRTGACSNDIEQVCVFARLDTAVYIRDWYEAIDINMWINIIGKDDFKLFSKSLDVYAIEESEVIL